MSEFLAGWGYSSRQQAARQPESDVGSQKAMSAARRASRLLFEQAGCKGSKQLGKQEMNESNQPPNQGAGVPASADEAAPPSCSVSAMPSGSLWKSVRRTMGVVVEAFVQDPTDVEIVHMSDSATESKSFALYGAV
jgi:hypothetical protein